MCDKMQIKWGEVRQEGDRVRKGKGEKGEKERERAREGEKATCSSLPAVNEAQRSFRPSLSTSCIRSKNKRKAMTEGERGRRTERERERREGVNMQKLQGDTTKTHTSTTQPDLPQALITH